MSPITIYCLIRLTDSYIFYIGLSRNLPQRLANHRAGWRLTNDYHLTHKFIRECNNEIELVPIQTIAQPKCPPTSLEAYYTMYVESLGFVLTNRINRLIRPFNQLDHSIYGATSEGMRVIESLFLENKSSFIW